MPYGTIYSDTVQGSIAATAPVFKDGNSVEIGQLCKSWTRFHMDTGSVVVKGSFNTSSVTKVTTGVFAGAYTVATADAFSSISGSTNNNSTSVRGGYCLSPDNTASNGGSTSTGWQVITAQGGSLWDLYFNSVAIFR
jgi:hypothetical protein